MSLDIEEELAAIERLEEEAAVELGALLTQGMRLGALVSTVDVEPLARVIKPLAKALEKQGEILRELVKDRLP